MAYFAKNTGLKLERGKRSVAVVHPRLLLDTPTSGYVTALIANERIKVFTVAAAKVTTTDTAGLQTIDGLRLKLTQAGANSVNRGLKRKVLERFSQFGTLDLRLLKPPAGSAPSEPGRGGGSDVPGRGTTPGGTLTVSPSLLGLLPAGTISPLLPGFSQDLDGDGTPDLGVAALPLQDVSFDAGTRTGAIKLGGGLVLTLPAGGEVALVDPEVVVGATASQSGLFAKVDGARVKIGDLDTSTLEFDVADGTVTVDDLHVTVGGALTPLLGPLAGALPPGTPLLSLDLSFPEA
ncbi:hypothetical protein [Solirubrobacter soli]|uniref:hypothetical protein n=1 Tax=Solirubrobacter soli TaxID=363832 RepID=UPI00040FFFD1|nr:hypothetical protein [Solirubrobacter soli]